MDYRAPSTSARAKLVEAITAPLGFFVLALLIVESFLATVLVLAELPTSEKMTGMWAGIVLFILVILIVAVFVWQKPDNLTFDKEAHLVNRGKIPYGSDEEQVPSELIFSPQKEEEEHQ